MARGDGMVWVKCPFCDNAMLRIFYTVEFSIPATGFPVAGMIPDYQYVEKHLTDVHGIGFDEKLNTA